MHYKLTVLLCLCLITMPGLALFAQDGYRPGRIYTRGKGGREGFIRYYPADGDSRLSFKKYLDDYPETFLLTEADSFDVSGEGRFISAEVPFTSFGPGGFRTGGSVGDLLRETVAKRVCLKRIVAGDSINLYEGMGTNRFYVNRPSGQRFTELVYAVFVNQSQLGGVETEVRIGDWSPARYQHTLQFFGYRDSLRHMLGLSHPFLPLVDDMPYLKDSLVAFARAYNGNITYLSAAVQRRRGHRFFVGGGFAMSTISLVSPGYGNFRPFKGRSFPGMIVGGGCLFQPQDEAKIMQWRVSATFFHYRDAYLGFHPSADSVNYQLSSSHVILSGTVLFRLVRYHCGSALSLGCSYNQNILISRGSAAYWRDAQGNSLFTKNGHTSTNSTSASVCGQAVFSRQWELFVHWTPPFLRYHDSDGNSFTRVDTYTASLSLNFLFK